MSPVRLSFKERHASRLKTLPCFLLITISIILFGTGLPAQETTSDLERKIQERENQNSGSVNQGVDPPRTSPPPAGARQPESTTGSPGGFLIPEELITRAPAKEHATLKFMNRKITIFRATTIGSPPAVRAERAVERLMDLVEIRTTGPVETLPIPNAILVQVAGEVIFAVTVQDLDPMLGETLESRTDEAVANLELALAEAEEILMPQQLIRRVLYALGFTLLFVAWVWVLSRLRRAIERRFLKLTGKGLRKSVAGRIASEKSQRLRIVVFVRRLVSFLFAITVLVSTYIWLNRVLELFPFTRPWGEALGGFLLKTAAWMGNGILLAIPGFFIVFVIFLITRFVSRLLKIVFDAVETKRLHVPGLHPETSQPTRRLVLVALWLLAVVIAYPYLPGSSSDAFKGVSVFLGLVISLGSTGIVNQAMSGLMLIYSRALRIGDFVKIGDVEGTVLHLGMLSTKVRSLAGEEVTVPNAVVISKETINYTRFAEEGVAIKTTVTIGYDTPWRQVHALLEEAAARTDGLRAEPKPFVLQTGLSDYYPEYRLMAVIDQPERRYRVLSDLHANIQDLFNQYGVQIMSPHYIADPPEPLIVPPDRRNPPPAPEEDAPSPPDPAEDASS